jgi:glycine/D-amino acid oxidase-like deaminating enzyme
MVGGYAIETDIALWHRDSYCWGGMSTTLVPGGGVIGLSVAMMLARQGHSVTVFEHDSEPEESLSSGRRTTCTRP